MKLPEVAKVLAHGPTKASVLLPAFKSDQFVQCDLRGVEDSQFPFALHYFTGSKAHNIAIRKRASAGAQPQRICPDGRTGDLACRTEADLFPALGLAEIPPELREDAGEIEAAEQGTLPSLVDARRPHRHVSLPYRLERRRARPLEEMAEAARVAGLTYLGIADHSRSAGMPAAFHRAGARAMGRNRRPQRAFGKFRLSRGPNATSWPTARSIIPTTCSTGSTTWSPAFIPISGCRGRR